MSIWRCLSLYEEIANHKRYILLQINTIVLSVCQSSECKFRLSLNLSAFSLKKGKIYWANLCLVTYRYFNTRVKR